MQEIDNGDLTIKNIPLKIQKINALIERLTKARDNEFTTIRERIAMSKEIQKIEIRRNNYNYKYDTWKTLSDEHLIES